MEGICGEGSGEGGGEGGGGEGDSAKEEIAVEESCMRDGDPWACRKILYDCKHFELGWLW